MQKNGTGWLIFGFALLHAGATMLCSLLEVRDSLLLTALTMTLAGIICFRENLTVEITVTALILVNLIGFILGNMGAQRFLTFLPPIWQHAVATFVVTGLLGWGLYAFAHRVSPGGAAGYEKEQSWYKNAGWLVFCIALVFGIRVYTDLNYSGNLLLENSGVVIVLVFTSLITLIFLVNFAFVMQREASAQRTRRHEAEFRYMNLKNQVNPHFLFNSLNVLDAIVQEGTREEASTYIRKMASLYRYMMNHEGRRLVPLAEEVEFASTYRQLMEIRFPEGLVIENRLGSPLPQGYIVPCTLQLLLENALKHNAIGKDKPLVISATTDGKNITVTNNRIPKLAPVRKTGIGLQYIRNQFRDLAGAEIQVHETDREFSVTVPVIPESPALRPFSKRTEPVSES